MSLLAAEPLPIGLVNIDRIFRAHKPFQNQIEPLRAEARELDETVQVRQAELENVAAQFRHAQPGSPEFQRLQLQAVKLQNELQQFIATEREKLQRKEAALYLGFHRQIDAEISKVAKAQGLKLVLRHFETSLAESENRPLADIVQTLNRSILFEEGLDITDDILKSLAARAASGER